MTLLPATASRLPWLPVFRDRRLAVPLRIERSHG